MEQSANFEQQLAHQEPVNESNDVAPEMLKHEETEEKSKRSRPKIFAVVSDHAGIIHLTDAENIKDLNDKLKLLQGPVIQLLVKGHELKFQETKQITIV